MKKRIQIIILIFVFGMFFTACKKQAPKTEEIEVVEKTPVAVVEVYACPMKCEGEKTYDKKGACPTCKMDLKKAHKEDAKGHEGHNH